MSNVKSFRQVFLEKLYLPIILWAKSNLASSNVSSTTADAVFGDYSFTTTD